MTKEECAIVTLYTGVAMLEGDDLEYLYRYAEKLMERPVLTHELATLAEELKKRAEPDFINLCRWAGAEAVPSAQPEKRTEERTETHACDCINRQAAIDAYGDWYVEEGTEEGFIGTVKQLLEGLPSAQPEQQWISVTEMLPDKTDDYLCSYNGCAVVDICEYDTKRNEWGFFYDGGWKVVSNVTAWMPLPEPYKEKDNERA